MVTVGAIGPGSTIRSIVAERLTQIGILQIVMAARRVEIRWPTVNQAHVSKSVVKAAICRVLARPIVVVWAIAEAVPEIEPA